MRQIVGAFKSRVEAVLLLGLGIGASCFALLGDYGALMNPRFRWITIGGAVLVTAMGFALLAWPRRSGSRSAGIALGLLLSLALLGRPFAPDAESGLLPFASGERDLPPRPDLSDYEELRVSDLNKTLAEETADLENRPYVMPGLVKHLPEVRADGHFLLLEPVMACCIADAIAYGIRVGGGGDAPLQDGSWVYVCGRLERLDDPLPTPPFRLGAIGFTTVCRNHLFVAEKIIGYQSLLDDLATAIPPRTCDIFRRAAREAGIREILRRRDGPWTVFVPIDSAFEGLPAGRLDSLFAPENRAELRRLVAGCVTRGRALEEDLHGLDSLETLDGRKLEVRFVDGRLLVGAARLIFGDQLAPSGVFHLVYPIPSPAAPE